MEELIRGSYWGLETYKILKSLSLAGSFCLFSEKFPGAPEPQLCLCDPEGNAATPSSSSILPLAFPQPVSPGYPGPASQPK